MLKLCSVFLLFTKLFSFLWRTLLVDETRSVIQFRVLRTQKFSKGGLLPDLRRNFRLFIHTRRVTSFKVRRGKGFYVSQVSLTLVQLGIRNTRSGPCLKESPTPPTWPLNRTRKSDTSELILELRCFDRHRNQYGKLRVF